MQLLDSPPKLPACRPGNTAFLSNITALYQKCDEDKQPELQLPHLTKRTEPYVLTPSYVRM